MAILKEISVEAEALKLAHREREKELMVEVMAIRKCIVDLFDKNPDKGFSNKQIREWLVSQGFDVNARQVPAKMKMMSNVFYDGAEHPWEPYKKGPWRRRVCNICDRPLQLGDSRMATIVSALAVEVRLDGHADCVNFLRVTHQQYKAQIDNLNQENAVLLADKAKLEEEVKRLRSMVVFLSQTQSGSRRIEL